jgi:hypothetical protein
MRQFLILAMIWALVIAAGFMASPAQAYGETVHLVQSGDTLFSVAQRYGVSAEALAAANGLGGNLWLYPGQQLIIPLSQVNATYSIPVSPPAYVEPEPATISWTGLPRNSAWYPAGVWQFPPVYAPPQQPVALPQALYTPPWPQNGAPRAVGYPNQEMNSYNLPVFSGGPLPQANRPATAEKWIDVNLTTQMVTAYEGQQPVFRARASTGIWKYPTVTGSFNIYVKYEQARMVGGSGEDAYDLADVPYVMYFHGGYGLHGTYWHNNFGTPMSHGCVNLSIPDAQWLFNWAPLGTKVVSHY